MYKETEGSTLEVIADLPCHIPQEGYIYVNGKRHNIGVYKRSRYKEEQYWELDPRWKEYANWKAEQDTRQKTDKSYSHPKLVEFINECWLYRLGGFWFYNNGVPTYITGKYWFYLNCIHLDTGLPRYREMDRQFFNVWQYSQEDPHSMGVLYLTKRRCFAKDTKVVMYDGSIKNVQDIQEGELVMGDDSTPRLVKNVCSGKEQMFRVKANRIDIGFDCNESHILSGVKVWWNKKHVRQSVPFEMTVKEYNNMTEAQKARCRFKKFGWELPYKEVPIDPYIMGAWLGDGMSRSFEFSNEDEEVIDYLKEFAEKNNLKYHTYGSKTKKGVKLRHSLSKQNKLSVEYDGIVFEHKGLLMKHLGKNPKTPLVGFGLYKQGLIKVLDRERNQVWDEFVKLGLKNNKHLPDIYLRNSKEVRLQVLAGIIDTDGCYASYSSEKNIGHFQLGFGSKAKALKDQIKALIISCGFKVTENYYKPTDATTLIIFGEIDTIPTKIKRKKAPKGDYSRSVNEYKFSVTPIGKGEYYGFEVDGNNLFLLANGIVVHNSGKSYIGGALSIENATRLKQFNAGIQSKTETDAKKAFKKCVIMPYRQLPYFFKVAKTNMTTKVPEKELLFRDNKGDSDFDDELSSRIDFAASGEGAYDGQKLGYYFADEVFKPQEVNVAERWSVVQFCLKDYDGSIIGKTLHTTTVEDMKSGNKVAMNMWKGSNPANKEEGANKTATGMYRFFVAGHKVRCLDKYGFADELKAREEIMMERKAKEKDPRELSGLIRKDPMSIEEAFYTDSEQCVFNPMLLTERENELKFSETAFIRGEFVWKDEKWGDVRFVQNPQGNIMLSKRFKMPQDLENRHTIRNGLRAPANNHVFAMGVDPYDHKIEINRTNERYLSKGSFAVVHKESGGHNVGDLANGVVCFYKFRHVNPDDFYSDSIKTMIYFGCDALIERDKPGLIRHMEKMRLQEYATRLSGQQQRGIKASRENTNGACELLDQYINDNIGYVDFIELVEEWKAFDPSDTTEFDGTMAMLYALLLLDMRKPKRTISKGGVKDIKELFSFWKATRR